jgi:predicted DNA-binding protein with PD1-like motif
MKYRVGRAGRVIVARLEDKDDIIASITAIAKKEGIRSAVFNLIGGIKSGNIVVGPEAEALPPIPVWRDIRESTEVVGVGTIFWQENEPKLHMHGSFGRRDTVKVGCLRGASETFLVLEVIIIEIEGIDATRELDQESGLVLLRL